MFNISCGTLWCIYQGESDCFYLIVSEINRMLSYVHGILELKGTKKSSNSYLQFKDEESKGHNLKNIVQFRVQQSKVKGESGI